MDGRVRLHCLPHFTHDLQYLRHRRAYFHLFVCIYSGKLCQLTPTQHLRLN